MNELVQMNGIRKTYDGKRYVLDGVDFSIRAGEIATIYGASGGGKSTLLNIIGLLDGFSAGEYCFQGQMIRSDRLNFYSRMRSADIGFVFQAYDLIDSLNVRDNILMPFLYMDRAVSKQVFRKMDQMLDKFHMQSLLNKRVSVLSGGEKQRVAILRAMIKSPLLLIADEPTGNLDEENAQIVSNMFQKMAEEGTAIIIVTHNKYLVFGNSCRYTLTEGRLCK